MPVRGDVDLTVPISSQDLGTDLFISIEHINRRMAEVVRAARAEDGDPRTEGADELRRARSETAVMRHFQDSERSGADGGDEITFDGLADVTCEDERDVAPAKLDHNRIVVADFLALPVGRRRMQDGDRHFIDPQVVAGGDVRPRETARIRGGVKDFQRLEARHGNAFPDMPRTEFLHDGARAADVIRIAMRQDEVVEATNARSTQDGSDDAIADVEGGRADESSGIEEQRRSLRQPDERRIALTDIEK